MYYESSAGMTSEMNFDWSKFNLHVTKYYQKASLYSLLRRRTTFDIIKSQLVYSVHGFVSQIAKFQQTPTWLQAQALLQGRYPT